MNLEYDLVSYHQRLLRLQDPNLGEDNLEEIAKVKMPDLNCYDIEAAKELVKGTAKSMGIEVPE